MKPCNLYVCQSMILDISNKECELLPKEKYFDFQPWKCKIGSRRGELWKITKNAGALQWNLSKQMWFYLSSDGTVHFSSSGRIYSGNIFLVLLLIFNQFLLRLYWIITDVNKSSSSLIQWIQWRCQNFYGLELKLGGFVKINGNGLGLRIIKQWGIFLFHYVCILWNH